MFPLSPPRCEKVKFEKPMAVSQDVSERVGVSFQRNICLQEALKKFKGNLTVIWAHDMVMAHRDVPLTVEGVGLWPISSQLVTARRLWVGWGGLRADASSPGLHLDCLRPKHGCQNWPLSISETHNRQMF